MFVRTIYAYLLWLPPLGWLGLHQYYMGRPYHAVWILTTFAGFFLGWFRDLWKIPTYASMPTEIGANDVGCCGICARIKSSVMSCLRRFTGRENTLSNDLSDKKDDLSDEDDLDTASKTREKSVQATAEESMEPKALVKKFIEELIVIQLRKEFVKNGSQPLKEHENRQILQVKLKSKIKDLTQDSLSTESITKLLQNKPLDEEGIKQRLELSVKHVFKEELVKIVKEQNINRNKTLPLSVAEDTYLSDNEEDNNDKDNNDELNGRKNKKKTSGLGIMDNIERVIGVFLTARYYRALVAAALSDYLESGWIAYYLLKLLPSFGMICGVYLVSNIGRPPRLTLSALFLSGLLAEVLFGVIPEILYGRSIQILICLVCTLIAVWKWEWPKDESAKQSNKYSCFVVTLCACIVMMLLWGSIVMNTTIEVDGNNVTISKALHNFYNSPAWSQMKVALWDTIIMYLEGNWDEASETLLRVSDLSGAERALSVLGLSRDANDATIKAQYKKLAREWHPDKYQGEDKEAASNKFIEIQQAYTLLTKRLRA